MRKKIMKPFLFAIALVAILASCAVDGLQKPLDSDPLTLEERSANSYTSDVVESGDYVELVIGLKSSNKTFAELTAEIEAAVNKIVQESSRGAAPQQAISLEMVHDFSELVESQRGSSRSSLLSEDTLIQAAYDKLTSETEKALFRDFQFKVHKQHAARVLEALKGHTLISYAQENYLYTQNWEPNDPHYRDGSLWGMTKTYTNLAWDITKGSNDVIVAVIDSGIDDQHPDLRGNLWRNSQGTTGYDFSDGDIYPNPHGSHGTHVAGTVGALGNNGLGVIGVSPNVKIMNLKIFPRAYSTTAAQALRYAVDNGARVINNSWGPNGRRTSDPTIDNAIKYAYSKNAVIVFSSGNDNDDGKYYFGGNSPYTISVAAVNSELKKSWFSNYGDTIDIAAPGVDTLSTMPGGGYGLKSGTSMAAPHVSGLAALILAQNPEFTNEQVRERIKSTATPASETNIGAGIMNSFKALSQGSTLPPCVSISTCTGKYLATYTPGGNYPVDTKVVLGMLQKWNLTKHADGKYSIGTLKAISGGCSDLSRDKLAVGGPATKWTITKLANGRYTIKNCRGYLSIKTVNGCITPVISSSCYEWTLK